MSAPGKNTRINPVRGGHWAPRTLGKPQPTSETSVILLPKPSSVAKRRGTAASRESLLATPLLGPVVAGSTTLSAHLCPFLTRHLKRALCMLVYVSQAGSGGLRCVPLRACQLQGLSRACPARLILPSTTCTFVAPRQVVSRPTVGHLWWHRCRLHAPRTALGSHCRNRNHAFHTVATGHAHSILQAYVYTFSLTAMKRSLHGGQGSPSAFRVPKIVKACSQRATLPPVCAAPTAGSSTASCPPIAVHLPRGFLRGVGAETAPLACHWHKARQWPGRVPHWLAGTMHNCLYAGMFFVLTHRYRAR